MAKGPILVANGISSLPRLESKATSLNRSTRNAGRCLTTEQISSRNGEIAPWSNHDYHRFFLRRYILSFMS